MEAKTYNTQFFSNKGEISQNLTKEASPVEILDKGVKEVSETGRLSFPVRRALWLALGAWEERDEMDDSPRTFTEPLQKCAQLALACACARPCGAKVSSAVLCQSLWARGEILSSDKWSFQRRKYAETMLFHPEKKVHRGLNRC